MKPPLTPTFRTLQHELTRTLWIFIAEYIQAHGYPPSIREIAQHCHLGRTTVVRYLDRLEAQGHLRRSTGVARSITLLRPPPEQ